MLKNTSAKLLAIIVFFFFIYIFLNLFYIKNDSFKNFINSNHPRVQKTIFATPAFLDYEKKVFLLMQKKIVKEPSYLERKINKTQFLKFSEVKYPLNSYTYTGRVMKVVALIEFYKKNLFVVSGIGEVSYIPEGDIEEFQNKILKIPTNIKDIIKDKSFYDYENKISRFSQFNSISDILIYNDFIYLSFNREVKDNCYTKSILRAEINFDYLEFNDFFFNRMECIETNNDKRKFNGHQSGGRMIVVDKDSNYNSFNVSNDKILFTVGDYRSNRSQEIPLAHDENSIFGKTLLIDVNTSEYKIFTKGHRNPQGLYYDKKDNIIISTEHGPYGGDEINILYEGKNYGWPISGYGENYLRLQKDIEKDFYFKKSHTDFGFEEPVIAFTKSIGISEITKVPNSFHSKWKNSYLATSLNGHVMLRFSLNNKFDKLQSVEIINVGERIRDIKFYNNKIYTILENTGSLGVFSISETN